MTNHPLFKAYLAFICFVPSLVLLLQRNGEGEDVTTDNDMGQAK
jgi:hypothetical protein